MRNGYFRLICGSQEVSLKVYKPANGGEAVQAKEVSEYLTNRGIIADSGLIARGLSAAAASPEASYTFSISRGSFHPFRESYSLNIREDNMAVTARFYPPSDKGERMTVTEFIKDLKFRNISYGILEQEMTEFFQNPRYCTDIVVAQGKEPRNGTDARIEYYFETDRKSKPTLKEDGSVDFFHLNSISHCQKGDLLARLIPEDPGDPGFNVMGQQVNPRTVKREFLKFGRNITISDDKLTLTSEVNGHVMLYNDKVFVSNVFEVENVDVSTGNIEYDGSVKVNGNVCTGFEIKATGNIEVAGVVEGARLLADGDIIIARGMNGMAKGELFAKGNIIAKFIENAKVQAEGSISTEAILHSEVSAGTFVSVTGKKGFITGGRVCATKLIQVKTLGSSMGADTLVEVGLDPVKKARIQELQKSITENNKMLEQIKPVLSVWSKKLAQGAQLKPDQVKMLREMMAKEKQLSEVVAKESEEYQTLAVMLNNSQGASVEVTGSVFGGTKIAISDVSLVVKDSVSYCRFIKDHGDVKMVGL